MSTKMILTIEKEQAELRIRDQIKNIRNELNKIEFKLDNKESFSSSDGLKGCGGYLERDITTVASYERALNLI